ncbi:MAG: hypothetical protein IJH47_00300 [Oscillospiraceae bacterium]|nr:hypothetical protein [Oscillospiraceae bacterium]
MKNNDEIEIDLLKLFKALWRRALVIILVAVVFASAVFAYTLFFISPAYDATASIYVNNSSFSFGSTSFSISASELNASNSLVNTYIYILKSRTTLEDVIAKGNLPYTFEQLSKMITTKTVTGTAAFDITVRSSSPTEAEFIANIIAQILPDRIAEIVDGSSVRIVDYAIVPAHRAAPSYTKNTIIGFLIGAVLAAAIVIIRFLIDEQNDVVIHSADELRTLYPDIKVLAMIPDMRLSEKKGYYYSSYYGSEKKGGK